MVWKLRKSCSIWPSTHGNVFLRFCIVYCSHGNREQPAAHYLHETIQKSRKTFPCVRNLCSMLLFTSTVTECIVFSVQGVPKKSIPSEMKPLLEVNALIITMLNPRVRYFSIVTRHSNSNKGFISKGILFFGTPCIMTVIQ